LMEIYTQLGPDAPDSLSADKAAIILQAIQDNPQFLRVKDGRELHKGCIELVKGTKWEPALFPVVDVRDERMLKEWRAREDDRLTAFAKAEQAAFEAAAAKSEAYVSSIKKQGKPSGLTSAKEILSAMGLLPTAAKEQSPDTDPDGPDAA